LGWGLAMHFSLISPYMISTETEGEIRHKKAHYTGKMLKILAVALLCGCCHGASLKYWVEACNNTESGCRAGDPELAQWAMEAWQAGSDGKLKLERVAERDKAHIRIYWANGRDGLYGETRPIQVGSVRGAEVYVLAPAANASDNDALLRETVLYLTCLHESGHALGLEHTSAFADIMYNFQYGGDIPEYFARYRRQLRARADIRKHSGMSADDRRRLLEIFR
jgi:hypothetical protein